MKTVRVSLLPKKADDRSYEVVFGSIGPSLTGALKKLNLGGRRVFVVTSKRLVNLGYARKLKTILSKGGFPVQVLVVPDGEKFKTLSVLTGLFKAAVKEGIDRRSLVMALGGGVISDLAGLFAATVLRGVSFVSIPTTLLGMVDAAIGGKTGVDLPQGKNLVGVFWQPSLVWIDTGFLRTLPRREWITGFAEVVKYGVIRDGAFFRWLVQNVRRHPDISRWPAKDVGFAVWTAARHKAAVVKSDEKETPLKGGREILNFGHTVGHALEAATDYQAMSHGEAVSVGMVAAGLIARARSLWSDDAQLQLVSTLEAVGLPIHVPSRLKVNREKFWAAIIKDKKAIGGRLRFVLPKKAGSVVVKSDIPIGLVKKIMASLW